MAKLRPFLEGNQNREVGAGQAWLAVACFESTSVTVVMANGVVRDETQCQVLARSGLIPEQRVMAGVKQSKLAIRVVEDGLRDKYPDADDATIASLLLERFRLMKEIQNRKITTT